MADPLSSEPSPGQVDAFIRSGRIGPAILHDHNSSNRERGVERTLDECWFSVKGESRYSRTAGPVITMEVAGWVHTTVIGQLHLSLGHSHLTDAESRFFSSCNIGWDAYATRFGLPRPAAEPRSRAHRGPQGPKRPSGPSLG